MARQGESVFKQRVLKDLDALPCCVYLKTQERARKGVLDIWMCLNGKAVSIELKIDGEKPTKLQEINIKKFQSARGISFYTTPSQWPAHYEMLKTI